MVELVAVSENGLVNLAFDDRELRLAGTVHMPEGAAVAAGLVFLHGSGPATRADWSDWAVRLADDGIATLRYDKLGCGESEGDWTTQSFDDRAHEALAALRALRQAIGFPSACIGLLGMSQGGWIAPLAASFSSEVSFAICLSSAGVTPIEQETFRIEHHLPAEGFSRDDVAEAMAVFRRRIERIRAAVTPHEIFDAEAAARSKPWFPLLAGTTVEEMEFICRIYDFDPLPALEDAKCPVLALWGNRDVYVPVERSVRAFEDARSIAGDEFLVLEGADHALRMPGQNVEAPIVFDTLTSWVHEVCSATDRPQ